MIKFFIKLKVLVCISRIRRTSRVQLIVSRILEFGDQQCLQHFRPDLIFLLFLFIFYCCCAVFIYTAGAHDVLQVRYPSDFKACNTQNPISVNNSGYTVIPLTMTGSSYFMCGIPGHCVQGMNLEVVVMTSEESAPSPNSPGTANSPLPISQGGPTSPPPTAITVEAPAAQQGNGAILQPPASTVKHYSWALLLLLCWGGW